MKVLKSEIISEYGGLIGSHAIEKFGESIELSRALRAFQDRLDLLDAIARSEDDASVAPILVAKDSRNPSFDRDWVCPSCGCIVGDYSSDRNHSQSNCEYCPDCGKRIDWPAVTNHTIREGAFVEASAVFDILGQMKASNNSVESKLAVYLIEQLHGKEIEYSVSNTKSAAPVLKTVMSPAFVDYIDEAGNLTGEFVDGRHDEYDCPVCGWFVDSHDFPFLYVIGGKEDKRKPCRYCMSCGQKIDWDGVALDADKYEMDFLLERA